MSANPTQKNNWLHPTRATASYSDTGRYFDPVFVNSNTQIDVTGQGYGAVLVINTTNLTVTASNGLKMTLIPAGHIYDIGLSGAIAGATGKAYLFKRQQ